MTELSDVLDLGSDTTVEFSCYCRAGKKRQKIKYAGMVKLADTLDLGSDTIVEFFEVDNYP